MLMPLNEGDRESQTTSGPTIAPFWMFSLAVAQGKLKLKPHIPTFIGLFQPIGFVLRVCLFDWDFIAGLI
jgi:hypothetical protein